MHAFAGSEGSEGGGSQFLLCSKCGEKYPPSRQFADTLTRVNELRDSGEDLREAGDFSTACANLSEAVRLAETICCRDHELRASLYDALALALAHMGELFFRIPSLNIYFFSINIYYQSEVFNFFLINVIFFSLLSRKFEEKTMNKTKHCILFGLVLRFCGVVAEVLQERLNIVINCCVTNIVASGGTNCSHHFFGVNRTPPL